MVVKDLNQDQLKSLKNYTIVLRPDDNGTYVAYIPAISGCHAWGKTPEEAKAELNNVFEMIKEEYLEVGKTLPQDVELTVNYANLSKRITKSSPKIRLSKNATKRKS